MPEGVLVKAPILPQFFSEASVKLINFSHISVFAELQLPFPRPFVSFKEKIQCDFCVKVAA